MVNVTPCHPTIGKVPLILNDIFKLSRLIGTFPMNSEFSGISKFNLAKGLVLYLSVAVFAIPLLYSLWQKETPLANKITFTTQILLQTLFHLINLPWLVTNRFILKELYEDLKDIDYHLWKNGVDWFHKPSWSTKYFSFVIAILYLITWEIGHDLCTFFVYNIIHYLTIPGIYSIMSQYIALIQICLSMLRDIRLLQDMRTVVKLNEKVLALCRKVNTLYEQQLLFYIVSIFFIYLFTIYTKIVHSNFFEDSAAWHLTRLLLFLHPLFPIIRCVGCISKEVKKINKMLYRKLLFNLDDETLQFHLVTKRDIVFSAGGFFDLGNTLIWSMFTTAITYLVFLVQYM
ncbi:Gustatory receptor 116b [Halyomorpha halys]|nr:Gustatory receptor 116b [Halyomorpha halys]